MQKFRDIGLNYDALSLTGANYFFCENSQTFDG